MKLYTTDRLNLRDWKESDLGPFYDLNNDEDVIKYLPKALSREESDGMVHRIMTGIIENGFGLWAVEDRESNEFIGLVGLSVPRFEASFTPCVEIGWRIARKFWGKGYATEAARKALEIGFKEYNLEEIVSFTVPDNIRSRKVMERIGMSHKSDEDFDHPKIESGHRLERHVLYRLSKVSWKSIHNK